MIRNVSLGVINILYRENGSSQHWLVVRKARPPDFRTFKSVNKPVTFENKDKKAYGVRIPGQIFTLKPNPASEITFG